MATVRFFDGSQLRLSENTLVLLNNINVSPGYARQGVIEVILHEGQAWVQTLNVADGYAGFTLTTRDAVFSTPQGTFSVSTAPNKPTTAQVYKYVLAMKALQKDTGEVLTSTKLNANQKIITSAISGYQSNLPISQFAVLTDLSEADFSEEWVRSNFRLDTEHLAELRDQELINLKRSVGVVPGQVLYPVKLIKERLALALRFDEEGELSTQMAIANKRLGDSNCSYGTGRKQPRQRSAYGLPKRCSFNCRRNGW